VHFWATWCEACVEELPLIDQFWREAKRRGIDVHAVSLDEPTPEAAQLVGDVLQQVKVGGLGALIVELRNPDTFMFKLDPNWGGELRSREGQARLGGTHDPRILFFKTFVADLTTPVKK
jgi:thiol-disulfide isomerase/thioredoxin